MIYLQSILPEFQSELHLLLTILKIPLNGSLEQLYQQIESKHFEFYQNKSFVHG